MAVTLAMTERGTRSPLTVATLRRLAARAVAVARVPGDLDLSVAFVNRARSAALNRQYRHKGHAADVLSFLLEEATHTSARRPRRTGEVILCPPAIRDRARREGTTLIATTEHLFIHGVLHLLGFTHGTNEDERAMIDVERTILTSPSTDA